MPDLRQRLVPVILGAVLTFVAVACSDDSSPTDTNPDEPDTTEPVGS